MTIRLGWATVFLLASSYALTQTLPPAFDGVEKWKDSLTGDSISSFKNLYSSDPPAKFLLNGQELVPDISPETDFWQKLVFAGATDFEVRPVGEQDRNGLHLVTLAISMRMKTPDGPRTRYVTEDQAWQEQRGGWRIVIAGHSDVVKMPPALHPNPNLYNKSAEAELDIKEAEDKAKRNHQRVILVFGANWCYDCHVLDQAFHQPEVAALLERSFQIVHVDIGDDGKKNNKLAASYQVPLNKGVPALAILDAEGKLLYSQKNGEWESARSLDPDDLTRFFERWKP